MAQFIVIVQYIFVTIFCALCSAETVMECKIVDNCTCLSPTGKGLNLSSLSIENPWLNATSGGKTFFYHPCTDAPVGNKTGPDDCTNGASLCLYDNATKTYQNLGKTSEMNISLGSELMYPVMFFNHNNIVSAIELLCTFSKQSLLTVVNSSASSPMLRLNSSEVCPLTIPKQVPVDPVVAESSLSTGSILVILFIVFTSLYFLGGALALKFLRGAEGKEMIPNYDFWVDLPNLVQDGITFFLSGCQTTPSYDRI